MTVDDYFGLPISRDPPSPPREETRFLYQSTTIARLETVGHIGLLYATGRYFMGMASLSMNKSIHFPMGTTWSLGAWYLIASS